MWAGAAISSGPGRRRFREHGYVEGRKSRAIHDQVIRLSAEVRQQAGPLVRAFGIPDKLLAAPIAL